MKDHSLKELERVVRLRNPLLAERLQPGLTERRIMRMLEMAEVRGAIGPLLELYCWKNGTIIDREMASSRTGLFPGPPYQFTELRRAIADFNSFNEAAAADCQTERLAEAVDRYFPILWNGAVRWMAVDLKPSEGHRVMLIDADSNRPFRQGYASFDDFIGDVIRANEEASPPVCFQTE